MSWLGRLDSKPPFERRPVLVWSLVILLYSLPGLIYCFVGRVNQDEGFYLYASRCVYAGEIPYADFAYSQAPLLPYVYGIPQLLFGTGLYVGRLTSLFFGVLTCILTVKLARQLGFKWGAVLAALFLFLNPFTMYWFTIVKTYSLAAFLMVLSAYILLNARIRPPLRSALALSIMCLAAGVRLSIAPAVLVTMGYIIYAERNNLWTASLAAAAGIVTGALVFVPFLCIDGRSFWFDLVQEHVRTVSLSGRLADQLDVFSALALVYFVVMALAFAGLGLRILRIRSIVKRSGHATGAAEYCFCWLLVVSISAAHSLNFPRYDQYEVLTAPFVAILAAWGCVELYHCFRGPVWQNALLLTVAFGMVLTFLIQGPYETDITADGKAAAQRMQEMANYINHEAPEGRILTFVTIVAVDADREVLPGLEYSHFFYHPDWSTDRAWEYHGVNNSMLSNYIQQESATVVLLTDQLPLDSDTMALLEDKYYLARVWEQWGPDRETGYVYFRK